MSHWRCGLLLHCIPDHLAVRSIHSCRAADSTVFPGQPSSRCPSGMFASFPYLEAVLMGPRQPWKPTGYVWVSPCFSIVALLPIGILQLFCSYRTNKSHQASRIQGAATVHYCLLWQPRSYSLFLAGGASLGPFLLPSLDFSCSFIHSWDH